MTSIALSVTDVARNFSEYVNRVAYRGDRFILMKSGKEVAEMRPVPRGRHLSELAALLKSTARLTPEEADSFGKDLDSIRDESNSMEVRNPWDS